MNVGFLGLGSMGAEMARNLARAGHNVLVWNRMPEKARALAADGARPVATPVELASCDAVVAMLANDEATRESVVGSGLLATLRSPTVFVNCATISLELARELVAAFAEARVAYVAAPVLGRPDAAAAAKLTIIAAGSDAALAAVQPLFDAMGQKTWPVGTDPTLANVAKIGANFLIASALESMAEAFAIAGGNGLEPRVLYDLVTSTLFAAPVYKNYGAQILDERFEPAGFALRLGLKDVGLALSAGALAGAYVPVAQALGTVFGAAVASGDGDKDWSAVALQSKPPRLARTQP